MPAPIGFHVKVDAAQATRFLTDVQRKQLPFIMAKSLTLTAKDVQAELKKQLPQVFDRPNRWTMNSLFMKPATKSKLSAMVWIKDEGATKGTPAVKYLAPQIYGGARNVKRFERALQSVGLLPHGMMAVPGKAAELDAHGNISRGQIVKLLSYLRAFSESGYSANITDTKMAKMAKGNAKKGIRGLDYFVLSKPQGKLLPGIYKRVHYSGADAGRVAHLAKGGAKPVVIFVKAARYRARWRFFEAGQRVALDRFGVRFNQVVREVLGG